MRSNVTILLASGRSVTGELEHGEQRLSDAINGRLSSVLRVAGATLGRFDNPAANEPVTVAIVPKSHVALVIMNDEIRRPKDKRMYSYVPKQTSELLVLLAGLRGRGSAHASATLDEATLQRELAESADHLIVLTDAWLAFDVEGHTERFVGVALLNARHIQFAAAIPPVALATADPREQLVAVH